MKSQDYVLIHASYYRAPGSILLIEKQKPISQVGRLNMVGGKIEAGELPIDAAKREFQEETGLEIYSEFKEGGIICGSWGRVFCYTVLTANKEIKQGPEEIEKVDWYSWQKVSTDPRLMPNLKVVVPLLREGVPGWRLHDEGDVQHKTADMYHTVALTV